MADQEHDYQLVEDVFGLLLTIPGVEVRRFPYPTPTEGVERDEQLTDWRDWVAAEAARLVNGAGG